MNRPRCGLINPPSAQHCDCGYDFETQGVEPPRFAQLEFDDGEPLIWWPWWFVGAAVIHMFSWVPVEAWLVLGVIGITVAGTALLWKRHKLQVPSQEEANVDVRSDGLIKELDQFLESYYLSPEPDKTPDVLADCVEAGEFQDPDQVIWYFFVRVGRDNPTLIRRYEAVFRSKPEGRSAVARILLQLGDERTKELLRSHLDDLELEALHEEVEDALENWPPPRIDPLAGPVTTAADLDMLWCEFRATGSTEPVLRIIDAFERPDRIRSKLENWLHETPPDGAVRFLWAARRKRLARTLWRKAAILCDLDRREILSPQDLDCHCTMSEMAPSRERIDGIAKLLPFSLEGEESTLFFKALGKWSLASHARQHPVIAELCKSEADRRTGRCRILLLEITTAVALAKEDLVTAFNALGQSLTPDPEQSRQRKLKADAEWDRLLRLSPESAPPSSEPAPPVRESALSCIQATQRADTFRTKRFSQSGERHDLGPGDVAWECQVARPANFRVFQTMWWESGEVYDDWVSLGKESFRGPMFVSQRDRTRLNSTLLPDHHLDLLRKRRASAFSVRLFNASRVLLFEFNDAPCSIAPWWDRFARAIGASRVQCDTLVWSDLETGHIIKVTETVKPARKSSDERVEIVHLFACYGEPVTIVPPSIRVFEPTR